ncbi:hypothetical protein ACF0H5_004541 [Mactra antiquata]
MNELIQKVKFRPIKGTLKIHSAKVDSNGKFCIRNKSCYCETCISGLVCNTWTITETDRNKEHTLPQVTEIPDNSNNIYPNLDEQAYVAGDFVAATYDGTWYIGKVLQIDNDEEVEHTTAPISLPMANP